MKKILLFILAFALVFSFSACTKNPADVILQDPPKKENENPQDLPQNPKENTDPYLSIYYLRNSADNPDEKEKVMLCYDINTEELTEVCTLPKELDAISAKYSRANHSVYYFSKNIPGDHHSENGLWKYDVAAEEVVRLDDENHSYNELYVIDENTLLLMMVTNEHPIMPVLFDIENKTFTYMADANSEPFIYTCGPLSLSYNHAFDELSCIYWSEEDVDNEYNSLEKPINYYLSATNKNLVKDPERTFSYSAKINENNLWYALQLSENEYIVQMMSGVPSDEPVEYYSLVFGEGEPSFTKIECPYPNADFLWNLQTIDGGETFFFYLRSDNLGNPAGIYSYHPKTEELSPILLYNPEIAPEYVGFSLMEDGSKPLSSVEEPSDPIGYMSFEDITAAGYYPNWMQPHTHIVYDENRVPTITEGGEITEEEATAREDIAAIGYYSDDKVCIIRPNTKAEYDLHGFLQNIYFLWPNGTYNLSPYSKTENAEITYYTNIDEYSQEKGKTVIMDENQCHSVFWLADRMNLRPESTSKPMDFPRYKITFTYNGTDHCIYIDSNNVFTSTMLEGGNYICTLGEDHFSDAAALFGKHD